jgi:glutamyl-tRNA reductase
MQIILTGINHKTASVDLRQKLAFDPESICAALGELKQEWGECEFALISTCNRVELYCAKPDSAKVTALEMIEYLAGFKGVDSSEISDAFYSKEGEPAVTHLLTVTCSLDSMVIGENQIASQVRDSYKLACSINSSGKVLNHLFHMAFSTSKTVFTNTSIASGRTSVAGVAVDLAGQLFSNVKKAKVVVLGAGEMGQLLVEHFKHVKCDDITIVNRTFDRASDVAEKYGVSAGKWEDVDDVIAGANIVVGAAAADDGYLFDKARLKKIVTRQNPSSLLLIDITVPRSFDPDINKIENVYLYNIDDLAQVVDQNLQLREEDIESAVEIICGKVAEIMNWLTTMEIGPLIGRMKEAFAHIKTDELDGFFAGRPEGANCRDAMDSTVSRVVNKLMHCVIENIDIVAKQQGPEEAVDIAKRIVARAEKMAENKR